MLDAEVLMDDDTWQAASLLRRGTDGGKPGTEEGVGGEGWGYMEQRDLHWWAAPGEWRLIP